MLSMIISGCKSNDVANATNENEVVIPAKGPAEDTNTYTFAEYMNNKDKETNLFFVTETDFGKDAEIDRVMVFEGENLNLFDGGDLTIGMVSKMTDEEILNTILQNDFNKQNEAVESVKEDLRQLTEYYATHDINDVVEETIESYFYIPDEEDVEQMRTRAKIQHEYFLTMVEESDKLKTIDPIYTEVVYNIVTDGSGNRTEKEQLLFEYRQFSRPISKQTGIQNYENGFEGVHVTHSEQDAETMSNGDYLPSMFPYKMNYQITGPSYQTRSTVYDSEYNIFPILNGGAECFVSFRTEESVYLIFDEPTTDIENITIDE